MPYLRRNMGVVFQDFRLIPTMTAYEKCGVCHAGDQHRRKKIASRVPYVFSLVGLAEKMDKYPDELSGGEQQRVALARALVHSPHHRCGRAHQQRWTRAGPQMMELLTAINSVGITVGGGDPQARSGKAFNKRVITVTPAMWWTTPASVGEVLL